MRFDDILRSIFIPAALAASLAVMPAAASFTVDASSFSSGAAFAAENQPAQPAAVTPAAAPASALSADPGASDTASIKVLRVGRIPYLDPRKVVRFYEKLMDYLKRELGISEARLVLTPDYNELSQFLKDGKVDIAWHGTFAYPRAREISGGKAILTPIWSKKKQYAGIIVVRADSGINKLADLKGKSFAFTDKKSASGYFLPKIMLLENGIDPDRDFSRIDYIKKHDNMLYNILYKKFDAGAVYDTGLSLLKTDEERAQLKVLATTPEILNEPIMVRADLPEGAVKKIKAAFMKLRSDDPETAPFLADIGPIDGFAEAFDADYDGIVKMVDKYKSVFEEQTSETSVKSVAPAPPATEENKLK